MEIKMRPRIGGRIEIIVIDGGTILGSTVLQGAEPAPYNTGEFPPDIPLEYGVGSGS